MSYEKLKQIVDEHKKHGNIKYIDFLGNKFFINEKGDIFSIFCRQGFRKKPRIIRQRKMKGYLSVSLSGKNLRVHRILAHCFLGLDYFDKSKHVHHINGKRDDNKIINLEVVDKKSHLSELSKKQNNKNHIKEWNDFVVQNDLTF